MSGPSDSFSMWTLSRPLDSDNAVRDALKPSKKVVLATHRKTDAFALGRRALYRRPPVPR